MLLPQGLWSGLNLFKLGGITSVVRNLWWVRGVQRDGQCLQQTPLVTCQLARWLLC